MPVDPSLKATMTKINKKFGHEAVVLGSEILDLDRKCITTGSLGIDAALGGGFAVNHFHEIVGHESVGKTFITLKMIAANQKLNPDWTTVWFAAEDFDDGYATMLGVDLERVIVVNGNAMEDTYESIFTFLSTKVVDCIVLDSLPALIPTRESENTMSDVQPGLSALLTNKFFRVVSIYIKRELTEDSRPVTCFFINQWRSKIGGYGDPRTTPGGQGKNFAYWQRVEVKRKEWITNTKGVPVGQKIVVTNLKNKFAPPHRVGEIDAYFAKSRDFEAGEYDLLADTVNAGIAYGVIRTSGGGYYNFEGGRWKGRKGLDAAIEESPDLVRSIREAVLKAINLSAEEIDGEEEEEESGRAPESVESPRKASGTKVRRKAT